MKLHNRFFLSVLLWSVILYVAFAGKYSVALLVFVYLTSMVMFAIPVLLLTLGFPKSLRLIRFILNKDT